MLEADREIDQELGGCLGFFLSLCLGLALLAVVALVWLVVAGIAERLT